MNHYYPLLDINLKVTLSYSNDIPSLATFVLEVTLAVLAVHAILTQIPVRIDEVNACRDGQK